MDGSAEDPPRLLSVVASSSTCIRNNGETMYSVSFPVSNVFGSTADGKTSQRRLCVQADFIALVRSLRRCKDVSTKAPTFPLRRFKKMSPLDDTRTHTKVIAQVNAFLHFCHEHAWDRVWWQAFLDGQDNYLNDGNEDLRDNQTQAQQRRSQARVWNQYFTPAEDAKAVVDTAQMILAGREVKLWIEPAAGAGDISHFFPQTGTQSLCIDIDPALCSKHGWVNSNFLTLSHKDILDKRRIRTKDVVICTNPPYVAYNEGEDSSCGRDGGLAQNFVRHSLKFADVCVFLLPERFLREKEREIALHGSHGRIRSRIHGGIRKTRFHLGMEKFKTITQPTVIASFERLER